MNIEHQRAKKKKTVQTRQNKNGFAFFFFVFLFTEQNVLYPRDTSTKWKHTLSKTTYTSFVAKRRKQKKATSATIQFKTIEKRYALAEKKASK